MTLSETVYGADGKPVGRVLQDSKSGLVDFVPREGGPPLPARPWRDFEELRVQLRKLYGDPCSPVSELIDQIGVRQR